MSEDETMARIASDLEAGRLSMARQRLRGLVGTYPQRLDLRETLADLYRREGLLSQAGRWSYLGENVDPVEQAAFENEYADPFMRMRALGWRHAEDSAGELVRQRLEKLRLEAEKSIGHPLTWERLERPDPAPTRGDRVFEVIAITLLILLVLGGVSFLVQGLRVVVSWFGL